MRFRSTGLAVLGVAALLASGCGGDDDASTDAGPADEETAGESSGGSLADACPETVVIQTDWYATPERAAAYQLVGPDGEIDASAGTYTGQLGDTGVERGGPPRRPVHRLPAGVGPDVPGPVGDPRLCAPPTRRSELAADLPTTAVVAPLDINPQILMWDPEAYDIAEWADVAATGATVTYLEGLPFMDFLLSEGLRRGEPARRLVRRHAEPLRRRGRQASSSRATPATSRTGGSTTSRTG